MGQTLADKFLSFGYGFTDAKYEKTNPKFERSGQATVTARDYATAPATFFGDRPLDNPGYSKMTLTAEVKKDSENTLDVLKVEQRLKYFGYSSFNKTWTNTVVEFKVDGDWSDPETTALRGFYGATHYTSAAYTPGGFGYEGTEGKLRPEAKTVINLTDAQINDTTVNTNFAWLNSFNAPHLVNVYTALPVPQTQNAVNNRFRNGAGTIEAYTTSWTYDWLQAWRRSQEGFAQLNDAQRANVLSTTELKINGLTSPPEFDS